MTRRLLIAAAFVLVGCEPSELRPIAVGGAAGGAGYSAPPASQPAQGPIAPGAGIQAIQSGDDLSNIPGEREVHFVMNSSYCTSMARRFAEQGLRLTFTRFIPSPQPKARRAGHCIFEGPDADANRFADPRYNNPDDYR